MAIGSIKVSKLHAVVGYVDLSADITLEYDSKNKIFTDTCNVSDELVLVLSKNFVDIVPVIDLLSVNLVKPITDVCNVSDTTSKNITINISDTVQASDIHPLAFGGVLSGAMFNELALNGGETIVNTTSIIISVV